MDEIAPTRVSMDWFRWKVEVALRVAVEEHGLDARGVAWTVLENLDLPRGYADIYDTQGVALDGQG